MPINKTFINDPSTLQLVETLLKESNMLPCAVIDEEHNIIYVHGRTGKFLEPAQGRMSVNIIDMAKPSLKAALTNALRTSLKNQQENTLKDFHLIDGDETRENDVTADITIRPIFQQEPLRSLMMVIFNEKTKANSKRKSASPKRSSKTISELEHELQLTRNSLQTSIEELETANEELKSSNEELQSTNEELQSTNEEIETSKEELQSLNEESSSVNAELQERIDELSKSNDDIKNLLDSTQIATLFLDIDLCVRRFTPKLTDLIPLSTSDVGRPIQHFANNLLNVDLVKYSNKVLDNLNVIEMRVKDLENNNYVMKLRPYRTLNNVIDGVVVTFDYSLTTS